MWEGDVGSTCKSYNRYHYDSHDVNVPPTKGLLTKVEGAKTWCNSSGGDFVTLQTNTYEPTWNNLQRTEDALQHGVSYTYDGEFHAFVTTQVNDLDHEVVTTYNLNDVADRAPGWPHQVTDPNGQTTTYSYDAYGRPLTIDRPLGASVDESWAYYNYQSGSPRRVQHKVRDDVPGAGDFDNYLVSWNYRDGLGRSLQTQSEAEESGQSIVQSYAYDQRGRLQRQSLPYQQPNHDPGSSYLPVSDWNGVIHTAYDYDPFARISTVTNPNTTIVRSFYNYLNSAVIDENDHLTITENDGFGRLIRSDQYDGTFTEPNWTVESYFHADYDYDVLDNLRFVTDRGDKQTEMQYDALGRKIYMNDPNMGIWTYDYDAVGNLTRQTDAREKTLCYEYDSLNRLRYVREDLVDQGCLLDWVLPDVEFQWRATHSYDEGTNQKGRRTSLNSRNVGTTIWAYDQRGRVTSETKTIGTDVFTTEWPAYDALDRLTEMIYPGSNSGGSGEPVAYAYNQQGLLNSVVGDKAYVESSSYDEASRLTGRVQRNSDTQSWSTTYAYHPWNDPNLGRLHTITASGTGESGVETFQNLTYTYDPVGNVASIVDGVAVQTQDFSYDDLDRLRSVSDAYDEAYEYFRGGSLQRKGDPINTSDGLYDYDDTEHVHAVTGYRDNSYGYDDNGNMTSRTVDDVSYALTYDSENRLISVEGGDSTSVFTYDGDGNRMQSVHSEYKPNSTAITTTSTYAGNYYEQLEGECVGPDCEDYAAEMDCPDGATCSTKYYYADGQLVASERSAEYGDNYGRRFLFRDHLGSTNVIVSGAGAKLWEDRFYPFGDVRHTYRKDNDPAFPVQTQYRYTGQWFEDGLGASAEDGLDRGLYFYGARWYDSSIGRFISPDTIVPEPGNPQSLNRYSYAANNALRYTDPSGHSICVSDDCVVRVHPVSGRPMGMRQKWSIIMQGPWKEEKEWLVYEGMRTISERVGKHLGGDVQTGDEWIRKNVGGTQFVRWPNDKPFIYDDGTNHIEFSIQPAITLFRLMYQGKYKGPTGFSSPQLGDIFPTSTIHFFDDMDETTPVHEVGHIVDYRNQSTSSQMSQHVVLGDAPSRYGRENRLEDFAESWRFWVYGLPGLTPGRSNFIESLVVQASR